jgi:hypothetical protein
MHHVNSLATSRWGRREREREASVEHEYNAADADSEAKKETAAFCL